LVGLRIPANQHCRRERHSAESDATDFANLAASNLPYCSVMGTRADIIETANLRLVPFDLRLMLAARAQDRAMVGEFLGCAVAPGWPSEGVLNQQLPGQIKAFEHGTPLKWLGRLMVLRARPTLIGVINLKGAPDEHGCVEIGYEVQQAFRRKGYASEAARALIGWCFEQQEVKVVHARTLKQNEPSQQMLQQVGFKRLGPQRDPRLGEMIVWELTPSFPSG
jgi:ribosomal-protein-alanine N-acetyltransferase